MAEMQKANPPTDLIAGSSGCLGQAIARELLARYRVIGLDVAQQNLPSFALSVRLRR